MGRSIPHIQPIQQKLTSRDDEYEFKISIPQMSFFAAPSAKYSGSHTPEQERLNGYVMDRVLDIIFRKSFYQAKDKEVSVEDISLPLKVMRFGPRELPTAKELL